MIFVNNESDIWKPIDSGATHILAYDSENDERFSTSYEAPYEWLGQGIECEIENPIR